MKTSKKIPLKTKNAKIIIFYTGNILEDSRTIDLGISEISILDPFWVHFGSIWECFMNN